MNISGSAPGWSATDRSRAGALLVGAVLFSAAVAAFSGFAAGEGSRGVSLLASITIFALLFGPGSALAVGAWADRLGPWISGRPVMRGGVLLLVPLVLYGVSAALGGEYEPLFL